MGKRTLKIIKHLWIPRISGEHLKAQKVPLGTFMDPKSSLEDTLYVIEVPFDSKVVKFLLINDLLIFQQFLKHFFHLFRILDTSLFPLIFLEYFQTFEYLYKTNSCKLVFS